jgi:gas vesicle protein GvpO
MTPADPRTGRSAQHRSTRGNSAPLSAARAAGRAVHAVREMTGRRPESVVSIEHRDEGWAVGVEVVETHRIPDSSDVLAVYEALLDDSGRLRSYRRATRYLRGRTEGMS